MSKIKKLFGGINMTWPKVLIFAVASAVVTAVLNLIPTLKDTSFQDIAIAFECWILFALIIILNCKNIIDAVLKCFVFFLVSQPLIYLIEVPSLGWGVFDYYKYWFIVTLLTIPGAAIAYQVKKKTWLSVAVLSVANIYLGYVSVMYFKSASTNFPHHILSGIFCIALAVFFCIVLLDDKKHRIAALAVVAAAIIAAVIISIFVMGVSKSEEIELGGGQWEYTVEYGDEFISVEMTDGDSAVITAKKNGTSHIIFKNSDGEIKEYYSTVLGGDITVDEFTG